MFDDRINDKNFIGNSGVFEDITIATSSDKCFKYMNEILKP